MNTLRLPESASELRQKLLGVAVAFAAGLLPILLYDLLVRRTVVSFLARLEWPSSVLAPLVLIICFSELLSECVGLSVTHPRSWSDRKHFTFVGIACGVMAIAWPVLYGISSQALFRARRGGQTPLPLSPRQWLRECRRSLVYKGGIHIAHSPVWAGFRAWRKRHEFSIRARFTTS